MKTLTRSLRPFPGGSLASTVRSENVGTDASAVGGGSKESKRKEVEVKHTYGARRLSKAPQDKRLPVKTLSKASIGTLARMVRDPSSLDSPGDPALHLGGGPGDVALETEVGRGMTEVALSTTKLADILKATERVRPEAQVLEGVYALVVSCDLAFSHACAYVCVCNAVYAPHARSRSNICTRIQHRWGKRMVAIRKTGVQ